MYQMPPQCSSSKLADNGALVVVNPLACDHSTVVLVVNGYAKGLRVDTDVPVVNGYAEGVRRLSVLSYRQ